MKTIIYAATRCGYCVQVIDGGEVVYEYAAGNCRTESQAVIAPTLQGRFPTRNFVDGPGRRHTKSPRTDTSQHNELNTTPIWKPSWKNRISPLPRNEWNNK